ncbi:MAG: hypothetical protein M1826_007418 [Phylliscum demangeonii]|nr:MAG: hypothetical protein M1826_007418 [Phylliscum demangeonii]
MTTARGPLAADNAIRAQDYLNDKIQTPADLENIDSLLSDVKAQQELLKQQLRDAETALGTAKRTSHEQRVLALEKAQSFSRRQADFDKRLLTITNAESSDQAAREFEESIEKLQNLDVAVGYIELLKTAEDLRYALRVFLDTVVPTKHIDQVAMLFKK